MEELMTAVGSTAELAGLMREHFIRAGFTREEAVRMTMEVIREIIRTSFINKED